MVKKRRKLSSIIGPGFVTGASDDDPSGILTFSQTGAQFGYKHIWSMVVTLPFMTVVQEMCGRIGMVTGKGLSGVMRTHYGRPSLYAAVVILFVANAINIGANVGAMASSAQLLFGQSFVLWLVWFTLTSLLLEVLVPYRTYSRYLKYLTLSLLAYVMVVFVVKQDWSAIALHTFIPTMELSREGLLNIVAIFGASLSPYLFFWQADEEVEEEVLHHQLKDNGVGHPKIGRADIRTMRLDTFVGMAFSNVVAYFIMLTAASTLFRAGISELNTAADAAEALRPLAGDLAYVLFAVGIIGTGLLAVPILAGSAGYAIAEAAGWPASLAKNYRQAPGFYCVIALAVLVGVFVNAIGIPPFKMLYYTAILNGVSAPPLLLLILLVANNRKIMGKYHNRWLSNTLGVCVTLFMFFSAAAVVLL